MDRLRKKRANIVSTVSGLEIIGYSSFIMFSLDFRSCRASKQIWSQVPSSFVIDLGCAVLITHVHLRNSGSIFPNPARHAISEMKKKLR